MFTYTIAKSKGSPSVVEAGSFLDRVSILKRNLEKNNLIRVGDRVKFKKPRRNPVYGKVLIIIEDPEKITWTHGGLVPMNVVVEVAKVDHNTRIEYGTTIVKTNAKKLIYAGNP